GRQAPEVGTADHHGAGAERQRLHHVAATPDAAVQQHLDLIADGVGDHGECPIDAGVPSRLLPPWLDTEIAETPASTACLASSTRITPLSMNGPPHSSLSQAISSHVGGGVPIHSP